MVASSLPYFTSIHFGYGFEQSSSTLTCVSFAFLWSKLLVLKFVPRITASLCCRRITFALLSNEWNNWCAGICWVDVCTIGGISLIIFAPSFTKDIFCTSTGGFPLSWLTCILHHRLLLVPHLFTKQVDSAFLLTRTALAFHLPEFSILLVVLLSVPCINPELVEILIASTTSEWMQWVGCNLSGYARSTSLFHFRHLEKSWRSEINVKVNK